MLEPRVTLEVPISINTKEEVPQGGYELNLTVKEGDGSLYGEVPFSVNIN